MKTTIGGDRLGSGNKQNVSLRHYERSTHDLSYIWRSSMSAGTLVPFMSLPALPGDTFDIDLNCEVLTLPTIGPLFGSFKVQLDVFHVPIRLYNSALYNNRINIGMEMQNINLPQLEVYVNNDSTYVQTFDDNEQINPSCILKYLGISGIGYVTGATNPAKRKFNAVPYLAYWDIFKQYYSNKMEDNAYVIHTDSGGDSDTISAKWFHLDGVVQVYDVYDQEVVGIPVITNSKLEIKFNQSGYQPDPAKVKVGMGGVEYAMTTLFAVIEWDETTQILTGTIFQYAPLNNANQDIEVLDQTVEPIGGDGAQIRLASFPLENIDNLREDILQTGYPAAITINEFSPAPYSFLADSYGTGKDEKYSIQFSQEGLAVKTYQSDLFNNWLNTEWIDGANGVTQRSRVNILNDGADYFTIDSLNIAQKVYDLLNRIAVSGGTYDNWVEAVYSQTFLKNPYSPVYHGSLIKELAFQEVVSNSAYTEGSVEQPLGTLAGRGALTNKHKGGKMVIKVDEPSYIMGIVSLTPRIDYSQGNKWDMNLKTLDDLHKPALDGIGYQDLITEQMLWTDSQFESTTGVVTYKSAGKQPAWINYMTDINKVYGNFADENKDMFMVNNRRYNKGINGTIGDLTTYIDPSKFNHIFAQTELDSQNFWVQISNDITARRKMSAKIIPNL